MIEDNVDRSARYDVGRASRYNPQMRSESVKLLSRGIVDIETANFFKPYLHPGMSSDASVVPVSTGAVFPPEKAYPHFGHTCSVSIFSSTSLNSPGASGVFRLRPDAHKRFRHTPIK